MLSKLLMQKPAEELFNSSAGFQLFSIEHLTRQTFISAIPPLHIFLFLSKFGDDERNKTHFVTYLFIKSCCHNI
jgi:hypothetical protein